MTDACVRVALPLPLASDYTYGVPEPLRGAVAVGMRAVVPVRERELIGIVTALDAERPAMRLRDVLALPDTEPLLDSCHLELARWLASYYGTPLGLALRAMLPAGMWGTSQVKLTLVDGARAEGSVAQAIVGWLDARGGTGLVASLKRKLGRDVWDPVHRLVERGAVTLEVQPPDTRAARVTQKLAVLGDHVPSLLEREALFRRSPRQRELLELLEALGGSAPLTLLRERHDMSDAVLRGLRQRGLVRVEDGERNRDPFAGRAGTPPPETPTPAQQAAIDAIGQLAPGQGALLYGVTGSGKTFVYLEAVRRVLAEGRGAIVLVPEIALTPQTVRRFRGVFGDDIAVLHSGLSDGERADAWRRIRRGECRVVVGARSAIFAPVPLLGLLVLDEEHEASYKNGESPRYHARDVAFVRARLEGAAVVLGSATPALETMERVGHDLALLRLEARIESRPMPPVELVDLRTQSLVQGMRPVPWSDALDAAVETVLDRGEQALLLLNRRGFAAFLQCSKCAAVCGCPSCSISLTVHRAPAGLRCHYCGHQEAMPAACPQCGGSVQAERGIGTQQLEQAVAVRFPRARIARMDLDTTGERWAHERILETVERGEIDLLIGTQMIAKGLDFPNVTLVGVVDADTGLHLPDFRASERTFQLLAQVAGRAGRGPKGGRVVVQTRSPKHHALACAAGHDTDAFLAAEREQRRVPAYPPFVAIANVLLSGPEEVPVADAATRIADWCAKLVVARGLTLAVLGPAPCPLARLKERWRWHVVLKGPQREVGAFVRYASRRLPKLPGDVRAVVDRDPVSLL
ncbi:MAG TPA: primosomal protein N' [Gemmatimonadales bacterium]|nr:primosomal protein N' [Gemmatimonadales bacterium]